MFFGLEAEIASNGPDANRNFPPIGYLALTLPHQLPNMILDSKRNKPAFGSSLMYPPTSDQRLSLEGDFNTHFDLYVPAGYERDALYIFTPDLMALLVDETGDYDVEIRGNQLLVHAPGGIDLSLPSTWDWIARVMSLVGAKMWSRTGQYADGRTTMPGVYPMAGGGELLRRARRLRRGSFQTTVTIAVFAVGFIAFVLYNLRG
jgi:hypothetical protein